MGGSGSFGQVAGLSFPFPLPVSFEGREDVVSDDVGETERGPIDRSIFVAFVLRVNMYRLRSNT